MNSEELKNIGPEETNQVVSKSKVVNAAHIVTADSVQAEEVPTIPIGSLQTISTLQPEVAVHSVASTRPVTTPAPLVAQPSEYRRSLGEWIQIWKDGLRLSYFPLSLLPILLGSVLAWIPTITKKSHFGTFHLTHFLGAIAAALLLQAGAHLINDYYDYLRGVDTSNTLGPGGLIQQGYIKPTRVLTIGLTLLGLGTLVGLILVIGNNPILLLFGLIIVLSAYFYSASSWALSSLTLGELVGFGVFGPLLTIGAYLLQTRGSLPSNVFIYSLLPGLLAVAIIHANNMRDIEGDQHAGKHTLATLIGLGWSRCLYLLLLLAPYAIIVLLAIPHHAPHLMLISLWTLPILVVAITGIFHTCAPAGFDLVMRQTLKLAIFFVLLLVIALIITAFIPVLPPLPTHLLPFL